MKNALKLLMVLATLVAGTAPLFAAEQIYKGVWPSGNKVTVTITDNKKVRYCVAGLNCLRGTFGVANLGDANNFVFRRGKKDANGSWGMRAIKSGNCYDLKYVWTDKGKTNEQKTKAC